MPASPLRKAAVCLTAAFSLALAGCGADGLGPDAAKDQPNLRGSVTTEQVFPNGPQQTHTRIAAKFFQSGKSYKTHGKLTIDGDLPDNVSIDVDNGKLVLNGSAGKNDNFSVSQPESFHTEKYSGYCYGYDFASGKFEYSYKMTPRCERSVSDGLTYPDSEPALLITGKADQTVKFSQGNTGAVNLRFVVQGNQP